MVNKNDPTTNENKRKSCRRFFFQKDRSGTGTQLSFSFEGSETTQKGALLALRGLGL